MHKRFLMLVFGGICCLLTFLGGICHWLSVAFVVDRYFLQAFGIGVCRRSVAYSGVCCLLIFLGDICYWRLLAFGGVCWRAVAFVGVRWRSVAFVGVQWRSVACSGVCCLPIFLETFVIGVCWHSVAFVGVQWRLLAFGGVCWRSVAFVGVRWRLLAFVGVCWRLSFSETQCIVYSLQCMHFNPIILRMAMSLNSIGIKQIHELFEVQL